MANSLQDQLRKSGLVSAQDARKANADKRKKTRRQRSGEADDAQARRAELQQAAAAKAERDRQLNAERKAAADARALIAQIHQLVAVNRIDPGRQADLAFNYVLDGKVRHFYVTEALRQALTQGQVAIVLGEDGPALVPAGAAQKIRERNAAHVLLLNERNSAASADDDPYAAFEVPDDLMW